MLVPDLSVRKRKSRVEGAGGDTSLSEQYRNKARAVYRRQQEQRERRREQEERRREQERERREKQMQLLKSDLSLRLGCISIFIH